MRTPRSAPPGTPPPPGERETTWWGEVFHLAKDGRNWYLHRGPATPHIPSMAAHSIAPLNTTLGDSTTLAGVYLNGWAAPTLTRDGDVCPERLGPTTAVGPFVYHR